MRPVCLLQTVALTAEDRRPGETGVPLADCRPYGGGPQTRQDRCTSCRLSPLRRRTADPARPVCLLQTVGESSVLRPRTLRPYVPLRCSPSGSVSARDTPASGRRNAVRAMETCLQEIHRPQAAGLRSPNPTCLQEIHRPQAAGLRSPQWKFFLSLFCHFHLIG